MKILHIITDLDNGGAEAVLYQLATFDSKMDAHFVISLMDRGRYADHLEKAGVTVAMLNMPRGKITFGGLLKLYKLIKFVRPNVVQTWMYHANLVGGVIAWISGFKFIVWGIHHANFNPDYNKKTTLYIIRLCAKFSSWLPAKIISCSVNSTRLHQSLGYRQDKFVNIPNGYELEKFKPDLQGRCAIREELGIESDVMVLGMVARFDPQKDHQNLIDALHQIKNSGKLFVCLLVGTGMDIQNKTLKTSLETADIIKYVKLLGPRNDIPAIMSTLDVHVLSSLGEAFPNVLAEAMACGTPCVTTDVGDAASIIGGHGWVVPSQNSIALANGLIEAQTLFYQDRDAWKTLQHACRNHILDNFELSQMCERYRQVWQMCEQP